MTNEEINRKVAEKVMGYTDVKFSDNFRVNGARQMFAKTEYSGCHRAGIGNFCIDIAAAWQVVEKMREKGWLFEIGSTPLCGWYVDISAFDARGNQTVKALVASKHTAPMAICLASLAALEA